MLSLARWRANTSPAEVSPYGENLSFVPIGGKDQESPLKNSVAYLRLMRRLLG